MAGQKVRRNRPARICSPQCNEPLQEGLTLSAAASQAQWRAPSAWKTACSAKRVSGRIDSSDLPPHFEEDDAQRVHVGLVVILHSLRLLLRAAPGKMVNIIFTA